MVFKWLSNAIHFNRYYFLVTYFISFQNLDFGQGYALSLIITIVTLVLSLGILKLVYRPVEY